MHKIDATAHAKRRMSQRAINEIQIRLIQEFGEYRYQKGGCHFAFVPEKTLAELRQAIDHLEKIRLVLGESDNVVTTLHEHRRVRKTQYVA